MIDVPVEVKDALREGTYKKNYRFVVLEEDGTASEIGTIDNDNLVKESVSIDERMCSGDTLKFGLCEGSSLEFQYFGKPNITGKRVQAFVDVTYGYVETYVTKGTVPIYSPYITLTESGAYHLYATAQNAWSFTTVMSPPEYEPRLYRPTTSANLTEQYLEGLKAGDRISVYSPRKTVYLQQKVKRAQTYTIPMGFFDVKKCSRQASTGIIKATCYNKLQSEYLDAKANLEVEQQFDDKDYSVLVYDLKRLMLGDYAIDQAEITEIVEDATGYSRDLDDATATKFRYLKGDCGPVGPFPLGYATQASLNTEFKLSYWVGETIWTLDPTKYYRIDSLFDLDAFEQNFYDYVDRIFTWSELTTSVETYMSNLVTRCYGSLPATTVQTWKSIFSIVLTKADDSEEWYSLIGQRNGLSAIGSLSDLSKKTITGYKKISFWTPVELIRYTSTTRDSVLKFYGGDFEYSYWDDEMNIVPTTWEGLKYPNGEYVGSPEASAFIDVYEIDSLTEADKIVVPVSNLPDFTMRDIVTAVYETVCQFGQLSRETDLFSGVELNHSRLYPSDTLYPSDSLYPSGAAASGFRSMYSKLWADEGNVHKWRYLIITYKGLNGDDQEEDFTLQRTINADGTDDYNMSDNWLFRNLVWTAAQVGDYADAMVAKMQDVTWFPFEMWCAGFPYIETGDEIEIPLGEHSYTSYVLQRQLKGIQNLQDTYINGTLDIF